MTKTYDRAYFDKWYRSRSHRVHDDGEVRRKIHLAVSIAEYFLRHPIRNVLDIGAGEGAWYKHLRSMRRDIQYFGVDPSDYVVQRFGAQRNIRKAGFADLRSLRSLPAFDLVVCSDVLHYVSEKEIRQGLPALVRLTGGVAFIEVLTREDDVVGDLEGLTQRPAAWYERLFARAGLTHAAPYTWLSKRMAKMATELELP
jgi:SAM-dependent methyltransferase